MPSDQPLTENPHYQEFDCEFPISSDPDVAADQLAIIFGTRAAATDWAERVHHTLVTGESTAG